MFAELPGRRSPTRPARLDAVRAQMDGLKQSKQAVAGDVLTSLSGFAPPMLLALGARLAARSPSLGLQTGVTNVPGPQQPLQTLGRRLLESYPFVPVIGHARISIAIFSYDGGLYLGVTGRLRQLERHRHPHGRRGALDGGAAGARSPSTDEPDAGQRGKGRCRGGRARELGA